MIRGIHHIAIHTSNFERMIAFYRDVMGFTEVSRTGWPVGSKLIDEVIGLENSAARQIMMRAGTCYLEIFEYDSPAARETAPLAPSDHGYTHFCLDVTDIEREFDRLSAAGMRFYRQRPGDFGNMKAVYGRDPDGNIIEIQETAQDHEFSLNQLPPLNLESSQS
jgi:glyoxylase I family protein